jgi:nucleoside-diphosphate-sugar epimerase
MVPVAFLTILVVGATGNTGKHVVRQLLDLGHAMKVIVRSKQRMVDVLPPMKNSPSLTQDNDGIEKLFVTEKESILELTDEEFMDQVRDVDVVVSCLGHTMDFKGIFGHPTRLVTDVTKRLTSAMKNTIHDDKSFQKTRKFILMSSDGVVALDGTDTPRSYTDRFLFSLIRFLNPHADNEEAAAFIYNEFGKNSTTNIEWSIVRPTNLVEGDVTNFKLLDKPPGSVLLGVTAQVTRANVAKAIVDGIVNDALWKNRYKFRFPVVHDDVKEGVEKPSPPTVTDKTDL